MNTPIIEPSDLNILFPEGISLELSGKTFVITPFKFGKLPRIIKVLSNCAKEAKGIKFGSTVDPELALGLIATCGEDLIALMAEVLEVEIEFIQNLEQDEAVNLLVAFYQVNKDFFSKKLLPILKSLKV
jgi:hypothetical protein